MKPVNPLLKTISDWFNRSFADPAAVGLFFTVVALLVVIELFGRILTPILVSIAIAYLLHEPVRWLRRCRFPNWLAVTIVYVIFLGVFCWALFGLVPMLIKQSSTLAAEIPSIVSKLRGSLTDYAQKYPNLFQGSTLTHLVNLFRDQMAHVGQAILSFSLSSLSSMVTIVLYLVLVPIMLFFFLKDSSMISKWMSKFLPNDHSLVLTVWGDVNHQIGNYVRGRVTEMIIVSVVSVITFALFGLSYSILLGVLVGVSVLIPYVGVVLVTFPVIIIGLIDWGWSGQFFSMLAAYAVIATLDANVLVPLLFSEAMDMHPVAIIFSVLFFGSIWGFWGVLLAIPLATVVQSILSHWPRANLSKSC